MTHIVSANIVHRAGDFKSEGVGTGWLQQSLIKSLRQKTLKDYLIGVVCRPVALLGRAHGPSQQWQAEQVTGDPRRRARQLTDPERDEMRSRAERVAKMHHASTLVGRCLRPVGFFVTAFGDYSARQFRHDFA